MVFGIGRATIPLPLFLGRQLAIAKLVSPAFLLELSLASYFDPHRQATRVFSQESLDVVGRGMARAIADRP